MAVTGRQRQDRDYVFPSGYSYYSNLAPAYPAPDYEPRQEPQRKPVQRPKQRPKARPGYRVRPAAGTKLSLLQRCGIVASIGAVAAIMLLVLSRYERIFNENNALNAVKSEIEQKNLELSLLTVELGFAVSLEEAKSTALAAGMNYPSASQLVEPDGLFRVNTDPQLLE